MAIDPIKRARERLADLRRETSRLEDFLRTYDELSRADPVQGVIMVNGVPISTVAQIPMTDKSSPLRDIYRETILILEGANDPVSSQEMLEKMTAKGIVIAGQNPRWNMAAKLSRMTDVVSIEGHGWWLKRRPYEKAGWAAE